MAPGATFEYHSTFTASEQYSDNFNLNANGQAKTSNWRTTLSPGTTILINSAKTQGSISATSGFTYDSSADSNDNFNLFPSLTANVRYMFNPRLSLTLTDSFNRNDNPEVADSSGLRQQRQTFTSNTFSASVDWLIDLLQTQYYYRNSYFSNSDSDVSSSAQNISSNTNQSNSTTTSQTFGLSASTRLGALNTVRVGYEYSISEPEQDVTSYGNLFTASLTHQLGPYATAGVQGSYTTQTLDDVRLWNISIFGTYGLPSGFSFSGSVGYSLVSSDVVSNQSGFSGNALVSYIHARGTISFGIFQDYRTTYQGGQFGLSSSVDQSGQNFGVVQTLGMNGNFTYQITPLVGSFIAATYTQNTNTGIGNTKTNESSNYLTVNAGVSWAVLRWLNLSLQYTRNQYNLPDRTENQGLLSATATF